MKTKRINLDERKQRQIRYFSEGFKKAKVRDIEKNLVTIAEVSRGYEVSRGAIYKWLYKYSINYKREEKQVVERMSDTRKIKALEDKIKELERIVGQKQIQIDFYSKMIDLAEEELDIDIKKKDSIVPSTGSGQTGQNTNTNSIGSTKA